MWLVPGLSNQITSLFLLSLKWKLQRSIKNFGRKSLLSDVICGVVTQE